MIEPCLQNMQKRVLFGPDSNREVQKLSWGGGGVLSLKG